MKTTTWQYVNFAILFILLVAAIIGWKVHSSIGITIYVLLVLFIIYLFISGKKIKKRGN